MLDAFKVPCGLLLIPRVSSHMAENENQMLLSKTAEEGEQTQRV
jgi:hypothetical protein